uniref:RNA-directed DNA polymerase n=1 Tax=Tanacetum cinerariifolium TaxID=118510 RepID=A0A6L2KNS1_TANCI|nr:DNA-directed DNA polymerase [Tanacetum cinerariifolium]
MLKRCEDINLVLNWEKCQFRCKEGIILGHKILKSGIEVDRAKVDVIAKLPYPTTVKGVRSFLGHAGFYRRFIQDFSKIARPMTHLLEKETPFVFSKECVDAFETLKKKLTEAPILVVPDWNLPFKLMCDASDFAIGAVLGQCKMKHFQPIHYASKTMTEVQIDYTTTEKEILSVVYAFEKFRLYLFLSKSIVYTDHSALKYLLSKQDAKPRLLRLVLLLQEFDITIHYKKGYENLADDYLSRLENPHKDVLENKDINENFPLETLGSFSSGSTPWTHFCNDQFARVMTKYGVTHRFATAYHPQTSGQVEVSNRGLKRILERTVGENRASWPDKLDDALWAFRTSFKTPIGCTPYKLVYGKSCHLLIELEHKEYWAYENSLIYKERTKKLHDSKIKNRIFNVELSQPNGPNFKVNGYRVKHYFRGTDIAKITKKWPKPDKIEHEIVKNAQKTRIPNIVEPEIRTIEEVVPMADCTMEELLQEPTEGYGEAIVIPEILAENFEIKTNLLQLVQTNKFHGFERDTPHTHISNFKRMTWTLKYRDVPNDAIKLMLFPYTLEGAARILYEKEPPNSILTWDGLTKDEIKAVTTHSGLAYEGPSIPTNSPLEKKLREKATNQIEKFFQIFHDLHFDISFADTLLLMPKFASKIKSLLTNKDKLFELAKVPLNENCSAMLIKKLPEKLGDPSKFLIPCNFPRIDVCHAFADLGASISLMPLSIWKKLSLPELTPTRMTLKLADRSITRPKGVAEDVFVKVGNFYFPIDFVVVDFKADPRRPIVNFVRNQFVKSSSLTLTPFRESDFFLEEIEDFLNDESIPIGIENSFYDQEWDILYLEKFLNDDPFQLPPMDLKQAEETKPKSSIEEPPELELKELRSHLEYTFLEETNKLPVIIAKDLKDVEKEALLEVLKSYKRAIAWKISDIKGIDLRFYTHKILMKEVYKPAVQSQRRVNTKIHDVIKKEVIKLLDAKMIYSISDSPWVSPIHCVPKKGGMIVVSNETNELIPTRLVTGWRVCIGYRKLNDATRKDHFPFPFMDQMLERLARNEFYCFLDGFSRYFQIPIDPQDQEKTTFTCPYATFAYCRMLFGLCNAPGIDLGHKISKSGIEVDRAKVDIIAKLPHPTTVKGVRSFLGHAGFYRRFIQDFSKIERHMTHLLEKETLFVFSKERVDAFETLKAIISDRGTHFCNDQFARVITKYRVTHRLATAYHPQTSGQVEVSNRGLIHILERTVGENRVSWPDKLDDALWAFCTTFKTPIGCTPYKLVYGKSCHLPIELEHKVYWALKHVNFDLRTAGDHRKLQLNEPNELRDQDYENSLIYKERKKKLHDSKIKNCIFNVGD